jgi:hypothetical protein
MVDETAPGDDNTCMDLSELKRRVEPLCKEFGVRRLDAFGSIARGEAAEGSDVDLLVDFDHPDQRPARRFFGLLHGLEDLLHCPVDLLTHTGLRNPYFKNRVMQERVALYEE